MNINIQWNLAMRRKGLRHRHTDKGHRHVGKGEVVAGEEEGKEGGDLLVWGKGSGWMVVLVVVVVVE